MSDNPKVSIIVPVYNCEKYLNRCLDSILGQTFHDWECLLVDDGSTDRSGEILDEYAEKDKRFTVFHKANGGVSSARNVGLEIAVGEYISFIDADDYVTEFYVSNLLEQLQNGSEMSVSFSIRCDENGIRHKELYGKGTLRRDNFNMLFTDYDFSWHTAIWGKMFRRKIINNLNLRFDDRLFIGEDLVFLYSYILGSNIIQLSSDTDYFYFYNINDSLTKRKYSIEKELYTYDKITSLINKVISELSLKDRAASNIMWTYASYCRRVLNALYDDRKIGYMDRLKVLENLDIDSYCKYINTTSVKERIYVCLLKRKCYKTYDALRCLVKYTKLWSIR